MAINVKYTQNENKSVMIYLKLKCIRLPKSIVYGMFRVFISVDKVADFLIVCYSDF